MKKKSKSPFEIIGEMFTEEDPKIENAFFINRILSYQPATILLAIEVNKRISRLPDWAIKAVYKLSIKKRKSRPFIYYPKSKKASKEHIKLRNKISSAFCTNENHSDQIIELIRKIGESPESYFGMK